MEITLLNRQRKERVPAQALERLARSLAKLLPPKGADQLAVCLVSDRAMTAYNRRYRGKSRTTDVLSFPAGGGRDPEGRRHLGDILISAPQAARQARAARHPLSRELGILLVHGYLHLLGYDHEKDDGAMLRLERRVVRRLLPRTRSVRP